MRILCLMGSFVGSIVGWMIGARVGLMTALMISTAGSGLGYVAVQSLLKRYLD